MMLHAWMLRMPFPAKWGGPRTFVADDPLIEYLKDTPDYRLLWEPPIYSTTTASSPDPTPAPAEDTGREGGGEVSSRVCSAGLR